MSKTCSKILEVLWELARSNDLPCHLIERALEEHLNVLTEIPNKETLRKSYVSRCIDDLKNGHQVVNFFLINDFVIIISLVFIFVFSLKKGTLPLLRHLLNVAKCIVKGTGVYHKPDKAALAEWNGHHEIIKLLLASLCKCHGQAVSSGKNLNQHLSHETVVDKKYGYLHGQLVYAHLELLQFLLKEADLYLPWTRCKEMWDILVANPDACEADREVIYYISVCNSFIHTLCVKIVLFSVVCFMSRRHATRYSKFVIQGENVEKQSFSTYFKRI